MGRFLRAALLALVTVACGSEPEGAAAPASGPETTPPPASTSEPGASSSSSSSGAMPEPTKPAGKGAPYPIVLAHGFFGFQTLAGVDAVTYFYGVKDWLAAHGEPNVFTPAVDPFNESTHRGEQLLAEVERIVRETGAAKVNLVGHSQGGLDVRFVAHARPDLVASVFTIATPHHGLPLSDMAFGLDPGTPAAGAVDAIVRVFGQPLWDASGNETSLAKALKQFSSEGIAAFNAKNADQPGIPYWSMTGRTGLASGGDTCKPQAPMGFVKDLEGVRDPVNGALSAAWTMNGGVLTVNDGLVPAASAKWGTFLGCIPADHFDEIGQLFGQSPGLGNRFAYKDLYVAIAGFLRDQRL